MNVELLKESFYYGARALAQRSDEINKLNVFPVPDGDTGTNMSLTLQAVTKELDALPQDLTIEQYADALTHGSLMGARGNSGVITSQILRGVAEGLQAIQNAKVSTQDIANVMRHARKVAFKAVRKPVEGTILTVISDMAQCADHCFRHKHPSDVTLVRLVKAAYESVARTPDLLPVLKDNGVVDSGAFGFAVFVEAFISHYLGLDDIEEISDAEKSLPTLDTDVSVAKDVMNDRVAIELNDDWEGSKYRYCTEFLFKAEAENFDVAKNLKYLASQGDCELLVGTYPHFKVHVHTNEPNKVLAYMLKQGQIFEVFIHNMDLEARERTEGIAHDHQTQEDKDPSEASSPQVAGARINQGAAAKKELGFIAVAAGEGEAEILTNMGVDVIIEGGQTMNPSTADFVEAASRINADAIIILPNNSNVYLTADAAAHAIADKEVVVAPTKTVPQAFAALFVVSYDLPLADNLAAMSDAAALVRDGEITRAVRKSMTKDGKPIKRGDIIGIANNEIELVGSDVQDVAFNLIAKMQDEQPSDTLTILAGKDLDDAAFGTLCERLEASFPDIDIDAQRGEQPLYPVIFSLE